MNLKCLLLRGWIWKTENKLRKESIIFANVFSETAGQRINLAKTHVYFSKIVTRSIRDQNLNIMKWVTIWGLSWLMGEMPKESLCNTLPNIILCLSHNVIPDSLPHISNSRLIYL